MAVTTALILASPQDSEPFHIEADSSDFASGASDNEDVVLL